MNRQLSLRFAGLGAAAAVSIAALVGLDARQAGNAAVLVDGDDIGGVVTGPNGPEAGVWVIAETTELGTRFSRTVVTDDRGRYVVPDLPKATYGVWVRGYGLVDSPKTQAAPGRTLNLKAVTAPNPRAAAAIFPAGYWYSLMRVPDESEFAATGDGRKGIAPTSEARETGCGCSSPADVPRVISSARRAPGRFRPASGVFPTRSPRGSGGCSRGRLAAR